MNKLSNPLGAGKEVWITQSNHGSVAGNPSNFDNHVAIDVSGVSSTPIYAVADGTCSATIGTGSARYFKLDVDDCLFRTLYVHCKSKFDKSVHVKKGQVIGEIIPYIYYVNGLKTQADHLHFGLQNKDMKTPHPFPMEYIDRTITFKTRYPSIEKLWFKNGTIYWAIFRDKDYLTNSTVMEYFKTGDVIELTGKASRMYTNKGIDMGRIPVGAVCTVMSDKSGQLPGDFTGVYMYNARFQDVMGYVIAGALWVKTIKYETQRDGTMPDVCLPQKEEITRLTTIAQAQELMIKDMVDEETNLSSQIKTMTEDAEKLQLALNKYADEKVKWEEDKTKLNVKIDDLKTQLTAKKAEVVAKLTVIETLHLALQKVWDKFFPGEN